VRFLVLTGKAPAGWPTPVIAAGESDILFPAAAIESDFAYTAHHPIAEAYRAYNPMPYDAATTAMAAMLYAVHPKEAYFKLSDGNLIAPPDQKDRILSTYIELASAKPVDRSPKKT
jgi:hypothetical protein